MDEQLAQLNPMFELFKQELIDIRSANTDAMSLVPTAWSGEASAEYINALKLQETRVTTVLQQVERLREKVKVFVETQSDTDTPL